MVRQQAMIMAFLLAMPIFASLRIATVLLLVVSEMATEGRVERFMSVLLGLLLLVVIVFPESTLVVGLIVGMIFVVTRFVSVVKSRVVGAEEVVKSVFIITSAVEVMIGVESVVVVVMVVVVVVVVVS